LKRGDIVTVATGSGFGGKPRPALVVQADEYHGLSTVVVALITTATEESPTSRPRILPDAGNGLRHTSDVMIDILVTAPREKVGVIVGRIDDVAMIEIDQALLVFLGLA
jgi:mRNA interferase MazF